MTPGTIEETPEQLESRLAEERAQIARLNQINGNPGNPADVAAWERQQREARQREEEGQRDLMLMMNRTPEEVAAGVDFGDGGDDRTKDGGKTYAFSSGEMRGAAVPFALGELRLILKPLKRRILRDQFVPLVQQWPRLMQFAAAVQKPKTPGIDAEAVAFLMTVYETAEHGKDETERQRRAIREGQTFEPSAAPSSTTTDAVRRLAGALVDSFDDYLPTICDTVWLMASDTPGLAWPRPQIPEIVEGEEQAEREWNPTPPDGCQWLDDALDDALYLPDYADLLRGLLVTNGSFPGSTYERFAKP